MQNRGFKCTLRDERRTIILREFFFADCFPLKIKSQSKLNLPGTRSGVRNDAGGGVCLAICRYCGGVRKAEIWMIENIEHLGSKRNIGFFMQFKGLLQGGNHVCNPRPDDGIPPHVPIPSSRRQREGTGVIPICRTSQRRSHRETRASGRSSMNWVRAESWIQVRTLRKTAGLISRNSCAIKNTERQARCKCNDAVHGPAVYYVSEYLRIDSERQYVGKITDNGVSRVKIS